jgi:hypothetical protein
MVMLLAIENILSSDERIRLKGAMDEMRDGK